MIDSSGPKPGTGDLFQRLTLGRAWVRAKGTRSGSTICLCMNERIYSGIRKEVCQ